MTRINVGIPPEELCDQHLLAEIRELPRVIGTHVKVKPPEQFKLGAGHVAWCAQYQASLNARHAMLVNEAVRRGFSVSGDTKRKPHNGGVWGKVAEKIAQPILRERIRERLTTMVRKPTWTNRKRPGWTYPLHAVEFAEAEIVAVV